MRSTRQQVYSAIDSECKHHESLPISDSMQRLLDPKASLGDALIALDSAIHYAKETYVAYGEENTLHAIRKVAAIAVRCMERHGALPKSIAEDRVLDDVPW